MDTFFDKEAEMNLAKKIEDLVAAFEVNYLIFRSSEIDQKKIKYSTIKKKLENNRNYKIKVDNIFPITGIMKAADEANANWMSLNDLERYWFDVKKSFFSEIDDMASLGENKYALNLFFLSLFDFLDERINRCSFQEWINEKDPANNKERMQLGIVNEFWAHSIVDFDFEILRQVINNEFAFRRAILNDIKYELVKVYSKQLIIPIKDLPLTLYTGDKTDMHEVILLLERNAEINNFETFKAIFFELLGLDKKTYKDYKSRITKREKGTFQFIKNALIKSGGISKID